MRDEAKAIAGKRVPRVGLGCMGMSEFYGTPDDAASLRVLSAAWECGYRAFDTADMYGLGANEELVGKFVRGLGAERHQAMIATKVGIERSRIDPSIRVNSLPSYVRQACEESLRRLGVDAIDLLYLHRRHADVPIEDTIGEMSRLVSEGKVRYLGLSEVSAETLRAAAAVTHIEALQCEYSLWTRDPEREHLKLCAQLDVEFVAYSPLGRGFLTGRFADTQALGEDDLRRHLPRFDAVNAEHNMRLVKIVEDIALRLGTTTGQVALAWILQHEQALHVIPGTRNVRHLQENFGSAGVQIPKDDLRSLDARFNAQAVAGDRYPAHLLSTVNT